MKENKNEWDRDEIRMKAEEIHKKKFKNVLSELQDVDKLNYELQLREIELQIQNEELRNHQLLSEISRRKYFDLYNHSPIGYFTLDENGLILEVNLAGAELLGSEKDKLIERALIRFIAPDFRNNFKHHLDQAIETGEKQISEIKLIKKDAESLYAHLESIYLYDPELDYRIIESAVIDINKRKKAEIALKESESKYRTLYETMTQGVIHQDASGKIISANPAAKKIMGINEDAKISDTYFEHHHDSIHEDGTLFPVDTHPSMIALKTGKEIRNVMMGVKVPEIQGFTWININATPLFKPGKEKAHQVYITIEDITDAVKAQKLLNETLDELKRSNEELEKFAYVASHDLQEPLRMVSSFTQLLERQYKDKLDDNAKEYINYAVDGAKRMQDLINDLLIYSRVTTKKEEINAINCDEVVDQVLFDLEIVIEERGVVIARDPLPIVYVDYSRMVQLFQNLICNGIKYNDKETPCIHISAHKENNEWIFQVRDNGIGIEPQYHKRIFEVFQRLHENDKYSGTGIGLSICQKIVKRYGGRIWLESEPQKGTTFYFTIPVR